MSTNLKTYHVKHFYPLWPAIVVLYFGVFAVIYLERVLVWAVVTRSSLYGWYCTAIHGPTYNTKETKKHHRNPTTSICHHNRRHARQRQMQTKSKTKAQGTLRRGQNCCFATRLKFLTQLAGFLLSLWTPLLAQSRWNRHRALATLRTRWFRPRLRRRACRVATTMISTSPNVYPKCRERK